MNKTFNYFSFSLYTKLKIKRTIQKYTFIKTTQKQTKYLSMLTFYGYTFLDDIINYYNNDLALTASICSSIKLDSKTESKICYHLENFFFRLISCWDYIFIGLNEYLKTGLIASSNIKQKIIEENYYLTVPTLTEEGFTKIYKIPLSKEKKESIKKDLNQKLSVLTPLKLKEAINKKYEINSYIEEIFKLFNTEFVQQAKTIKNTIIHSDSLNNNFNFTVSDIFKDQAISSRRYYTTKEMVALISINMELLKRAISQLNEMITLDHFPNRIEDKSKQYSIQLFKCRDCNKEYIYPADYIEKYCGEAYCFSCDTNNMEYIETAKVSQPYYEQIKISFLEDTIKNFES